MKLLIITQKVDQNDQLLGFFVDWIARFAEKFEKITVICLEKGEFELPENVRVISLGKDRGSGKLRQLSSFYFLLSTLRNDYNAVFVHMNPIWMVLGGICWKILGKKRILWYTHKSVTLKLRLAEKLSDIILTASPESFRLKSKKIIVTGHGIDTELFKPAVENVRDVGNVGIEHFEQAKRSNNSIRILSVGRIAPVKNYETLIDAVKILADEGIDLNVTLVGEPALDSDKRYLASLKFKVKSLKLEERFNFIGKINHGELPEYYRSNDIFVHLSKTGSLDKTLLEAMACGMTVLSSNDAAKAFLPAELIFKDGDPIGLAEKMADTRQKIGNFNLREYVIKNHDLDRLIEKISSTILS